MHAQGELRLEGQYTLADGDHAPLWLNANRHGLSSLDTSNGYLRASYRRGLEQDSTRRWKRGIGADMALATGFTSTAVLHQLYGELQWGAGRLTLGAKERQVELKDSELSSGAQTLGINARPVPGVQLALPHYWSVPGTKGWLAVKGHVFYGWTTDDHWQQDFTHGEHEHTRHTMLHTKAGYLRVGQPERPLTVEMGLEMGCQFGGESWLIWPDKPGLTHVENATGLKSWLRAFVPSGGDSMESDMDYKNTEGNHLGSWLLRVNYDKAAWGLSLYADHFFDDQSQMFFLDYDGYGKGDEWDKWKHSRWMVYDLRDIMLGAELRLKRCKWVERIVAEYLYTKYQSGPIYHDHTRIIADHLGGKDNYYNNSIFNGWQHWGQVVGNPLYRSPLYNDNGEIKVLNNRFVACHFAWSGTPMQGLHYRMMATWQKGWGTYNIPFYHPCENVSLLAEVQYFFPQASALRGWSLCGAFALDRGSLLNDNTGVQLTIGRTIGLY